MTPQPPVASIPQQAVPTATLPQSTLQQQSLPAATAFTLPPVTTPTPPGPPAQDLQFLADETFAEAEQNELHKAKFMAKERKQFTVNMLLINKLFMAC